VSLSSYCRNCGAPVSTTAEMSANHCNGCEEARKGALTAFAEQNPQASESDKLYAGRQALMQRAAHPRSGSISPRDFARRFTGEVLDAAGFALAGAIADFFPRSRIAQALRENLPKLWKKAEDQMIKKIEKMVNDPFPDLPSPTNSPASSESPPPG